MNFPLTRVLRCSRHFGFRTGIQIARLHGPPGRLIRLQLPRFAHPVWVRSRTSDVVTFEEVFVTKHYELPFRDFVPRHILDLGANVGFTSVYFARHWPHARILAVEPEPTNVGLLKKNTSAWPQITPCHAAVWARAGRVSIANPSAEANAFRVSERVDGPASAIPALTVAQLIAQQGCSHLDLLKMDIEGAEAEILRHAGEWLDRVSVLVIELHDRIVPGCAQALCDALRGRAFHQEIVGNNLAIDFRPSPTL
jgi:FkbM family methyltransferase